MIQYLIIQLDDTSVSYCHYQNGAKERKLISLENLKAGILFAMKENLMIQFVLPDYELSTEYKEVMNSIDSHLIVPATCNDANAIEAADVIVFDDWTLLSKWNFDSSISYVLRTDKENFFKQYPILNDVLTKVFRLNVVITDIDKFSDADFEKYKTTLETISESIAKEYLKQHAVQFNLLTDRLTLEKMNNCGAGETNITLAPNGKFYVCPAFYYDGDCDGSETSIGDVCNKGYTIGSLKDGLDIKNPQLYKIENASLCRKCDAYQCKRCIWLNRKTTMEVNTPSHEQCVAAHIERNASRKLMADIRIHAGDFLDDKEIKEIDYLDPFDVKQEW